MVNLGGGGVVKPNLTAGEEDPVGDGGPAGACGVPGAGEPEVVHERAHGLPRVQLPGPRRVHGRRRCEPSPRLSRERPLRRGGLPPGPRLPSRRQHHHDLRHLAQVAEPPPPLPRVTHEGGWR